MSVLVELSTPRFRLFIKGEVPRFPPFLEMEKTRIEISTVKGLQVDLKILGGPLTSEDIDPLFAEDMSYVVTLLPRRDYLCQVRCETEGALTKVESAEDLPHEGAEESIFVVYLLRYDSQVGFSTLSVTHEGRSIASITFEVFPTKLSYRKDFNLMTSEIAQVAHNLIMKLTAPTYERATARRVGVPTLTEWMFLLKRIFRSYLIALEAIARDPAYLLLPELRKEFSFRARKVSHKTFQRIAQGVGLTSKGKIEEVLDRRVSIVYDTAENRFLKHTIDSIERGLKDLSGTLARTTYPEGEGRHVVSDLKGMLRELRGRRRLLAFLNGVQSSSKIPLQSMIIQKHPFYSMVTKYHLLLRKGLIVDSDVNRIPLRKIWELYEYWCFIKLVGILAEHHDLVAQNWIKVKRDKILVRLRKGRESRIVFRHRVSSRPLEVTYSPLFRSLPTTAQKPDYVIQINSAKGTHVLDAKYRIAYSPDYLRKYLGPGPEEDDLNTMHRYRDAIVTEQYERYVEKAIVLFPYEDEADYENHHFRESITKVGIGALPFAPRATDSVRAFLETLVRENA